MTSEKTNWCWPISLSSYDCSPKVDPKIKTKKVPRLRWLLFL